jgi:DNA-binding transcriptional regulator GbsR (MarR family)
MKCLFVLKFQYSLKALKPAAMERFVEELGVHFELEAGAPRMVGRVFGWLLVCDPREQSAADLAESLQASRGSISTATRVLLRMGLVERVRLRGERFDRFRARPEVWDEFLWRKEQFSEPRRVLRMGLDALADEPAARREALEELDAIYAWWEERVPKLREEYVADRARARKRGRR